MISTQKKFLFIHVPKTGENSIQNILRDYSEDEIVIKGRHQDGIERFGVLNKQYNITKHSTLSHCRSVLEASIYRSMFKFATIRNPWDMMISLYFSPHRGIKEWDRNEFLTLVNKVSTLRQYICVDSLKDRILAKLGVRKLNFSNKLDADIDFQIKFEHLNDDFKVVCEQIGIPHSPLPKRNVSVRAHYSKFYDDELREIVRNRFKEEIKFGNYRLRIPDE